MKNQRKGLWYLSSGLGILSGIRLVDRFIIDVPDWLAYVFVVFAIIFGLMGSFYIFAKKSYKLLP